MPVLPQPRRRTGWLGLFCRVRSADTAPTGAISWTGSSPPLNVTRTTVVHCCLCLACSFECSGGEPSESIDCHPLLSSPLSGCVVSATFFGPAMGTEWEGCPQSECRFGVGKSMPLAAVALQREGIAESARDCAHHGCRVGTRRVYGSASSVEVVEQCWCFGAPTGEEHDGCCSGKGRFRHRSAMATSASSLQFFPGCVAFDRVRVERTGPGEHTLEKGDGERRARWEKHRNFGQVVSLYRVLLSPNQRLSCKML